MNAQPFRPVSSLIQARNRTAWFMAGALALLVAVVLLPAVLGAQAKVSAKTTLDERRATVHFASLGYQPTDGGAAQRILARDILRINMIASSTGDDYWLEVFYHSGDYIMQKVSGLIFYRRDGTAQQAKVSVNLLHRSKIGFPFVN